MTDQDEDLLARLLLRWEELAEHGQEPSSEELAKDRPDLRDELDRRIQALKATSWLTKPLDDDPPFAQFDPDDPDHDPHPSPSSRPLGRRYRLDALVGEGGFAQVYRAYDLGLHRTVAVKIPKPSRNQLASTFLAEARKIAGLKHESIVAVHDVGVEDRNVFIVSEFMEGGSLAQRIAKATLTEEEATRWIAEIADALQYAHANGILHRDIKPANVLTDHHGKAKLADFGIASLTGGSGSSPNHFGTLNYMSPEQLGGGEGDARSDIYGLGVVMYEALTGSPPPAPSSRGRDWLKDVPKGLRRICDRALSHDPAGRHPTAGDFAKDVRSVATRRQRTRVASWVAGLCGVALLVGLIVAPGSREALAMWVKKMKGDPVARITVTGFGDRQFLSGTLPVAWAKEGVFAEIKEPGSAVFERLNESAYVMELDVTLRNPKGRVAFVLGEPKTTTEVQLGRGNPYDELEPMIACRLIRAQQHSGRWFRNELLPPGERVNLQIVVADDLKFIVREGKVVGECSGDATDFQVRLVAEREVNATIHGVAVRPLTPADASIVECEFPVRTVTSDIPATEARLKSQEEPGTQEAPVVGMNFCLKDPWLSMRWIAPDEFTMGQPGEPLQRQGGGSEKVKISRGYWIGRYEATQGLWEKVMGDNPSRIQGSPYLPVNYISWSQAVEFCKRFTEQERERGRVPEGYEYRLPTEAEWEYASRAGDVPPANRTVISPFEKSQTHLKEVGFSKPNNWGLYETVSNIPDETSNVPEWCLDKWVAYPKDQKEVTVDRFHPGEPGVDLFILRGGRDGHADPYPSSFTRFFRNDTQGGFRGLRLALGPELKPTVAETKK